MSEEKYRDTIEVYNNSLAKIQKFDSKQKKHLDRTIQLSNGNVILDIGCGTGKDLDYLKNNYCNLLDIGLDRSDAMLNIYKGNSIKGDMRYIPLKDNSCDIVMMFLLLNVKLEI